MYRLPDGKTTALFTADAIAHFWYHRQCWPWSREAGGQLFARFSDSQIEICKVRGPSTKDRRGRFWFLPDRKKENQEIRECFVEGLHYIGDWHTHPQVHPIPSTEDLLSIAECFKRSEHELFGFLIVIVGIHDSPDGLWVGWHDGSTTLAYPVNSQHYYM